MSSSENPHSSSTTRHVSVEDFPEPLTVLHYRSPDREDEQATTYYLLGTAHVSSQSCEDARSLIEKTRPQVVMLELCAERKALLSDQPQKEPNLVAALSEVRAGRSTPFQAIYGWLLSTISKSLEVMPGEEFRVALKAANRVGAQVPSVVGGWTSYLFRTVCLLLLLLTMQCVCPIIAPPFFCRWCLVIGWSQ